MKFDETKFLGTPGPDNSSEEKSSYDLSSLNQFSPNKSLHADSEDEMSLDSIPKEKNANDLHSESGDRSPDRNLVEYDKNVSSDCRLSSSNVKEQSKEDSDSEMAPLGTEVESDASTRYPRRVGRPPQEWHIASYVITDKTIRTTTSDDPSLKAALSSSPEEKVLRLRAIDEEFKCLEEGNTWKID